MSELTIYHNPACSESRETLALIREHGFELRIVEYLKAPPSEAAASGRPPQDVERLLKST